MLHLYTPDRGRVGAVAKGVRRVGSRLGGRLEPLSRVRLVLHQGRGELCTVSQVDTVHPHAALRERRDSLERATQACEAVLRLLDSTESNPPAYHLLCHELGLLDETAAAAGRAQALTFRLKLLLAAGFAPGAGRLRRLRRGRAPGRVLAERRRGRLRRLRGGLVPARRGGAPLPRDGAGPPARGGSRGARAGPRAGGSRDRRDARVPRSRAVAPGCVGHTGRGEGSRGNEAGLRLRRGLARHARPARRQGGQRRRDDARAGRRARSGRLHDHHRGLRRVHAGRPLVPGRARGRGRRGAGAPRGAGRQAARRLRRPAARVGALAAPANRCPA